MYARQWGLLAVMGLVACRGEPSPEPLTQPPPLAATAIRPAPLRTQRLTAEQYRVLTRDLFGEVSIPQLEPDLAAGGLLSVGAAETAISPWGVERYEAAAFGIARQVLSDPATRDARVGCRPEGPADRGCAGAFLEALATKAWRRPVEAAELEALLETSMGAAAELGDFYVGLEFGIAAILQSPSFLYRVEYGEPAPDGASDLRYTSYEMASRLSFLFWNAAPDDALLAAAASGALTTDDGVRAAAERLLASDRARQGLRNFFTERFELYLLDRLSKDPAIFTYFSPELGASAKEQTLRDLEHLVFDADGDFRDLFTAEETFVDRRLAALYGIQAPAREGFGRQVLEPGGRRRGFLGQASFLALRSHAVGTSATLRGKFVLEVLLCRTVAPPPVNANTAIPEVSESARTLRERLTVHMEDPVCASCHRSMDGIGLAFEKFDGVGRRRELDNGVPIDTRGVVDELPFDDVWAIGQVIHDHPDVPRCFVRSWYEYATGTRLPAGLTPQIDDLTARFERSGFRVKDLLVQIALSPGFRRATEAER
jgi:hypothetical protein